LYSRVHLFDGKLYQLEILAEARESKSCVNGGSMPWHTFKFLYIVYSVAHIDRNPRKSCGPLLFKVQLGSSLIYGIKDPKP
jgi:hypothetical protein